MKQIGIWRSEIGFVIRDASSNKIFERKAGTTFNADTVLGRICPGCSNSASVEVAAISAETRSRKPITDPNDVNYVPT